MWDNISMLLENLFLILGGMTVFMMGMKIMSNNLEQAAGSKMRAMMGKISNNRLAGVGIGAAVTALMNSSGATTVMLVGFVNVGVISLKQATAIIMGANIGTTISAQIFAFAGASNGLSVTGIFALISFVGLILTMVGKNELIKQVGHIMIGIGFIFIGLNYLSGSVNKLIADPYWGDKINGMFIAVGRTEEFVLWQMIVLFILGMVITALVHSSAAVTGIVISLAGGGLITMNMAIFITLGSNIGTCFTSIVASLGTGVNARRTAVIHLAFNVIGCVIFIIPLFFLQNQVSEILLAVSSFGAEAGSESIVQHAIANFHLIFNVVTTLILLPFTNLLVKFASAVIPDKTETTTSAAQEGVARLDGHILESPAIAITQVRKEIVRMANLAFANYKRSLRMLVDLDFSEKQVFDDVEDALNDLNKEITSFCIRLSSKDLSMADERKVSAFFRNVSDLERIGDYAQNITEYAAKLKEDDGKFSADALVEIAETDEKIGVLFSNVLHCLEYRDMSVISTIDAAEDDIDHLTDNMQAAHIERMNKGLCNPSTGAVYLQLSGNLERIADHMVNVANSVKTYVKN